MRYPEEFPKAYRRKGIRQKRTKRGQKTRGEDGRREEAFITKIALLPFQVWRTNKTKGLIHIKNGGGKTGFWYGNNTNQQLKTWKFRVISIILRRQNGDKARTGRFLGRSSRPTHHRDAKEGRSLSGHAHGLIDHNHPLLPFDKDLANRVASTTIGAGSATSCASDKETISNKFIHRISL